MRQLGRDGDHGSGEVQDRRPDADDASAGTMAGGTRVTHELRQADEGSPTRRGKPEGVACADVWVKLIDAGQPAPTDPNALSFLTMTTRPKLRTDFCATDGGKAAVYTLRGVNTRDE